MGVSSHTIRRLALHILWLTNIEQQNLSNHGDGNIMFFTFQIFGSFYRFIPWVTEECIFGIMNSNHVFRIQI